MIQSGHSNTVSDGFLIGHKRGSLFFIEKAFPSQKGFFSSLREYFELKQKLDDRLLGFYSFKTNETKLKKILAPVAYGKVYLRIEADQTERLEIKPFIIEFDQDFYLLPIDLKPIR